MYHNRQKDTKKEVKMTKTKINSKLEKKLRGLITLTNAANETTNDTTKQLLNNEITEILSSTNVKDITTMRDHMEDIRREVGLGILKRNAGIVQTNFSLLLILTIDDMEIIDAE